MRILTPWLRPAGWRISSATRPSAIVEAGFDHGPYGEGHVPGAVAWSWKDDFQHPLHNDLPDRAAIETAARSVGDRTRHHGRPLRRSEQLVRRVWLLAADDYGHTAPAPAERWPQEVAGRGAADHDRVPTVTPTQYRLRIPTGATAPCATTCLRRSGGPIVLVDVRSREEWEGKLMPPWTVPNPEGQRGGRIPGQFTSPGRCN